MKFHLPNLFIVYTTMLLDPRVIHSVSIYVHVRLRMCVFVCVNI